MKHVRGKSLGPWLGFAALTGLPVASISAQQPCETQQLLFSEQDPLDELGEAMALDGGVAVFGMPNADSPNEVFAGRAVVYEYTAGGLGTEAGWYEAALLHAPDDELFEDFGESVAVAGETIVVGCPAEGLGDDPSAYVFRKSGGSWQLASGGKLAQFGASRFYGSAVACEGNFVVVGDPGDDTNGTDAGAAYVYENLPQWGSGLWLLRKKLLPLDGFHDDEFGTSVAMQGGRIVVGAPFDDQPFASNAGAAYVFELGSGADWVQTVKLLGPFSGSDSNFGRDVDVDGDQVAVGARDRVHVFGQGPFGWTAMGNLAASDQTGGNDLGRSVSISGNVVASGARLDSVQETSKGAVYVFVDEGQGWPATETHKLTAFDGDQFDYFGTDVALDGATLMSGSPGKHTFESREGLGHVFDLEATMCASPYTLSLATGGSHEFRIDADAAYAGQLYVVIGTTAGNSPGLVVDGQTLPLNYDGPGGWYPLSLQLANTPGMTNTFSVLDGSGASTAWFNLAAGHKHTLAGLVFSHATLVFDTVGGTNAAVHASNPVHLTLTL